MGYEESELATLPLTKVNGVPINSLLDAARAIRDCTEPMLRLELADAASPKLIVLPTAAAREVTDSVLATHAIASSMSDDLRAALSSDGGGGGVRPKKRKAVVR